MQRTLGLLLALCTVGLAPAATGADPAPDFEQQLRRHSAEWLGRDYVFSPLGEAQGVDDDPRLRLDAFDCTTYVETVLAFSLSNTASNRARMLDQLRYQNGQVDFEQRRHFPAAQWLPGLQKLGVLREITDRLAGAQTGISTSHLTPARWRQREWRILRDLPAHAVPTRQVAVPYLPLALSGRLAQLNEVALLSVVHAEHPDVPLLISHQALLIPSPNGPRVRHARDGIGVVEESLQRFVARLRLARRWPVLGLNVADLHQPISK